MFVWGSHSEDFDSIRVQDEVPHNSSTHNVVMPETHLIIYPNFQALFTVFFDFRGRTRFECFFFRLDFKRSTIVSGKKHRTS